MTIIITCMLLLITSHGKGYSTLHQTFYSNENDKKFNINFSRYNLIIFLLKVKDKVHVSTNTNRIVDVCYAFIFQQEVTTCIYFQLNSTLYIHYIKHIIYIKIFIK